MSPSEGSDALLRELKDPRFSASFALGLSRASVEAPPALIAALSERAPVSGERAQLDRWPLVAVALLGQERMFRWPSPPELSESPALPTQAAPFLLPLERAAVRRLVQAGSDQEGLLAALWGYLDASDRVLHPFDYASLEPLLRSSHARPGSAESVWLAYASGREPGDVEMKGSQLDDQSWREATPAAQARYVVTLRLEDPALGRARAQEGLEGAPAATRCQLVEALGVGLSADDEELLQSLSSDRAKSVQAKSQELLSRLPGTSQYQERVEGAVAQLDVGKRGLPGRKKSLKLRRGGRRPHQVLYEARGLFEHARLDDVAKALRMDVQQLLVSSAKDALLQSVLLGRALREGRSMAELALTHLPDADPWEALPRDLRSDSAEGLGDAFARALRPRRWDQWPAEHRWQELWLFLRGPLPADVARELLDCKALRSAIATEVEAPGSAGHPFLMLVGLTPPELHPLLQERLSALPFYRQTLVVELIHLASSLLISSPHLASSPANGPAAHD